MKKHLTRILLLLTIITTALCIVPQPHDVQAAMPKISRTKATLTKGKQLKLKVTGTKKKPKWSSNKKKVATVTSKGVVKAKGKGTARITAKVGKQKLVCRVTVEVQKNDLVAGVDIGDFYTIKSGKSKVLRAYIYPTHALDRHIYWKSSDESVAKVDKNGVVKGLKLGTAKITAVCGGKSDSCRIDVIPSTISIVLSNTYQKALVNRLGYVIEPCETQIKKIIFDKVDISNWKTWPYKNQMSYSSYGYSGMDMINWDDNKLEYYWKNRNPKFSFDRISDAGGEFSVSVILYDLYASAKFVVERELAPDPELQVNLENEYQKVKVNKNGSLSEECKIKIESIIFDGTDITEKLIFPMYTPTPIPPDDITPKDLYVRFDKSYGINGEWSDSSKEYTISSFIPSSDDSETGYIDVIVSYGIYSTTKRFTIEKDIDYVQIIPVEIFQFNQETFHIYEGESQELSYSITPEDATDKSISFASSNEQIAIVGEDGTVEAKMSGECTITATCGGIEANCKIVVSKKFSEEEALNSLTSETYENGSYLGVKVTNNYEYTPRISPVCTFYDSSGNIIEKNGGNIYERIPSSGSSLWNIAYPRYSNGQRAEYSQIEISYNIIGYDKDYKKPSFEYTHELKDEYLEFSIQNNFDETNRGCFLGVVFYKDGAIIGHNYTSISDLTIGNLKTDRLDYVNGVKPDYVEFIIN